ncbi:hypothetical protein EGW08_000936 [Elysia chlorotica]|uniref:Peptidase S1 domain-containing protein n=1 Tax=Elysia chlorotica TaxID=188477 RepID=A0A433UC34_ELYCH|nr:hypothetical protein EGW08_000936 [Elysia chlorotica]
MYQHHTFLVGCLLIIHSVPLDARFSRFNAPHGQRQRVDPHWQKVDTQRQRVDNQLNECRSHHELYDYKPCPKESCNENGASLGKCCLEVSQNFHGDVKTKECRCDSRSGCPQDNVKQSRQSQSKKPASSSQTKQKVPPAKPTTVTIKPEASQRNCTFDFEIQSYKTCSMEFCDSSSQSDNALCCKHRQSLSIPETCLCHPQITCDLPKVSTPDDIVEAGVTEADVTEPVVTEAVVTEAAVAVDEPSLCENRFRLLNADRVTNPCKYNGVAKLTRKDANGDALICNAVYTIAKVKGTIRHTFLTPQACGLLIEQLSKDMSLELQVGDQIYPVQEPIFTTESGPNGNWYIGIGSRYINLFRDLGACQKKACPYDAIGMRGKVDFNDCKAVSYGASDAANFTTDGLYETSIALYPGGCLEQDDFFGVKSTLCFRTIDAENAYCANDAGGPVYCKSPSTNEWILLGILAFQNKCDTQAELKVIPFPL